MCLSSLTRRAAVLVRVAFGSNQRAAPPPAGGSDPYRMLFADKRALETNLKVSLLAIREKELNFYTTNCLAVGTQSALLAGFAYSGLTQVAFPHEAPYLIKLLYMLTTTTAMGFELIAVMNTTLLSMVGPGLALRGHVRHGQSCPGSQVAHLTTHRSKPARLFVPTPLAPRGKPSPRWCRGEARRRSPGSTSV